MSNTKSRALTIIQKFCPQVKEVNDSTKSLIIEVTEKDSKTSKLKNHAECALAVACKRKEKADAVIISVRSAYLIKGNKAVRYRVPESTAREVVSFDRNGGFQPGTYKLKKPCFTERLGGGYSGRTQNKSNRKSVRFSHHTSNIRTSLTKE